MRHKHHIIPKHLGGTDDESNIVELTLAEHADAHNLLYCQHKNKLDKIAELALLGIIDKKIIMKNIVKKGKEHPNSKLANIYCYKTDKLLYKNVIINEFCKANNLYRGNLYITLPGHKGKSKSYKGMYIKYVENEV